MKLGLRITLTALSGVGLAGWLTGCAILPKDNVARSTTEYNLVAEKAGNEMLLLNIVRASQRRPMYFTSFAKLTGNISYEFGTGGMSIPFGKVGGGASTSYSVAPSVGYKYSPLFDLSVLDTQEFTRGITTPVPMAVIEYYWSQGWPKEMLLHLFIRQIEIRNEKGEVTDKFLNDPEDQKEFEHFQNQLRTQKWAIRADPNPDATKIAEVDANMASRLKDLIEAQKAGLTLKQGKTPHTKELHLSQDKYVFERDEGGGKKTTFTPDSTPLYKVYIRSPEAILYYLGEILRVENRDGDPNIPKIKGAEDGSPYARLFYARKARPEDKAPSVSVEYEGVRYVIPQDPQATDRFCRDRSMHVLSLVSQLIGLQKKSEQLPTTSVVSVIGR